MLLTISFYRLQLPLRLEKSASEERAGLGWPGADTTPDPVQRLLREALAGPVVALPFLAGTLAGWEHDFYENDMPVHRLTPRWWDLADAWQGLELIETCYHDMQPDSAPGPVITMGTND